MNDTSPITKDELLTAISSTLATVRPEFNDDSFEPVVKFATELEHQIEKIC